VLERVLIVAGVAVLVAGLVAGGRLLAERRLVRLRAKPAGELWNALGVAPDGRATVVVFSSPSCGACWTAQKPAVATLIDRVGDAVRVIGVDIADRPDVAGAFGVLTVPATVVMATDGAVLAANHGFATAQRLAAQLGIADASLAG
jgi:thioredoxin 1